MKIIYAHTTQMSGLVLGLSWTVRTVSITDGRRRNQMGELNKSITKKQRRMERRERNIERSTNWKRLPGKVPSPICPPNHSRERNLSKYPDGIPHSRILELDTLDEEWGDVLEGLE